MDTICVGGHKCTGAHIVVICDIWRVVADRDQTTILLEQQRVFDQMSEKNLEVPTVNSNGITAGNDYSRSKEYEITFVRSAEQGRRLDNGAVSLHNLHGRLYLGTQLYWSSCLLTFHVLRYVFMTVISTARCGQVSVSGVWVSRWSLE